MYEKLNKSLNNDTNFLVYKRNERILRTDRQYFNWEVMVKKLYNICSN